MKAQFDKTFEDIISTENLLLAWREFANGKKKKQDVQEFSLRLMDNILFLYSELHNQTHKHGHIRCSTSPTRNREISI